VEEGITYAAIAGMFALIEDAEFIIGTRPVVAIFVRYTLGTDRRRSWNPRKVQSDGAVEVKTL